MDGGFDKVEVADDGYGWEWAGGEVLDFVEVIFGEDRQG